jgi:hypothetical protein
LSWQAKNKSKNPKHVEALAEMLIHPLTPSEVFNEHNANCPDDKKYARVAFIDWLELKRRRGRRLSSTSRMMGVPMEEGEFVIYCTVQKGWTEQDAKSEWEVMKANPEIDRDNDRLRNTLQLYVPRKRQLEDDTTFSEAAVEEGSKWVSGADRVGAKAMLDHTFKAIRREGKVF